MPKPVALAGRRRVYGETQMAGRVPMVCQFRESNGMQIAVSAQSASKAVPTTMSPLGGGEGLGAIVFPHTVRHGR